MDSSYNQQGPNKQDQANHMNIIEIMIKLCQKAKINHYIKFKVIEWMQEYLKIF